MPDIDPVLKNTIEVSVDGFDFVFKIPSFADQIKLGLKAKQIRQELELELLGPNPAQDQYKFTTGAPTYDNATETYVDTVCQFTVLLKQSSAAWIYSEGDKGQPVIDYKKWPDDKFNTIVAAGVDFSQQLSRFRSGRPAAPKPPLDKTVDSQQDTAQESVQP